MSVNVSCILFVDDDENLLEIYQEYFNDDPSYKFIYLNSGESAKQYLKNHKVDLIVSDSNMGRVSGRDLALFCDRELATKPIFYLATGDLFENEFALKDEGIKRIIFKPFDLESLFEKIKSDLNQLMTKAS